jgi:hypothetical protein
VTPDEQEKRETINGWACRFMPSYPDVMIVECECGHTSVRDRDEVPGHVCPRCGKGE